MTSVLMFARSAKTVTIANKWKKKRERQSSNYFVVFDQQTLNLMKCYKLKSIRMMIYNVCIQSIILI